MKTYKVWKFVLEDEKINEKSTGVKIRKIEVIASGLTWQEAKNRRRQNKNSEISPEA